MKTNKYFAVSIATLLICAAACIIVLTSNSLKLSDMLVRITGAVCIISLVINVFCSVRFFIKR